VRSIYFFLSKDQKIADALLNYLESGKINAGLYIVMLKQEVYAASIANVIMNTNIFCLFSRIIRIIRNVY